MIEYISHEDLKQTKSYIHTKLSKIGINFWLVKTPCLIPVLNLTVTGTSSILRMPFKTRVILPLDSGSAEPAPYTNHEWGCIISNTAQKHLPCWIQDQWDIPCWDPQSRHRFHHWSLHRLVQLDQVWHHKSIWITCILINKRTHGSLGLCSLTWIPKMSSDTWRFVNAHSDCCPCRRFLQRAISPHVMSTPYSLQILRKGKLPTYHSSSWLVIQKKYHQSAIPHTVVKGAR